MLQFFLILLFNRKLLRFLYKLYMKVHIPTIRKGCQSTQPWPMYFGVRIVCKFLQCMKSASCACTSLCHSLQCKNVMHSTAHLFLGVMHNVCHRDQNTFNLLDNIYYQWRHSFPWLCCAVHTLGTFLNNYQSEPIYTTSSLHIAVKHYTALLFNKL